MKKYFLSFFLLLIFYTSVLSQTAVWQMPLSNYNEISRLDKNFFKVVQNGKIGFVNADGTIVAPAVNDEIIGFYENKALVTQTDGHGERVMGCLSSNYTYYGFAKKYYTLNGQKFFSDNLLSVSDENGKLGYIDTKGNEVVGFDGKYSRIKPFTEGYAAVKKGNKYILIDKNGDEDKAKFLYSGSGDPVIGCTNAYNGIVYVYDKYHKFFIYNTKTAARLVSTKEPRNTETDYLYCYQVVTGRSKEVPYKKMEKTDGRMGLSPFNSNGLYGYQKGNQIVLPPQFSYATPFIDDYAVVSMDGKMGVLRFVEGPGFSSNVPEDHFSFTAGQEVTCRFNLNVPCVWRNKDLDVVLKDENGTSILLNRSSDTFSFRQKPLSSCHKVYKLSVHSDGLRLFETTLDYWYQKKVEVITPKEKRCPTCGKLISECEYYGVHY